jgi:hypothetical protein
VREGGDLSGFETHEAPADTLGVYGVVRVYDLSETPEPEEA